MRPAGSSVLAAPAPGPASFAPWTQRLIEAAPVAPAWIGLLLLAAHVALFALFVVASRLLGSPAPPIETFLSGLPPTVVFALLIGFSPAATAYTQRSSRRWLRALAPALRASAGELRELEDEVVRFHPRLLRAVGCLCVASSLAVVLFDPEVSMREHPADPVFGWTLWQNALAFWLAGRTAAHEIRVSALFSRLGAERAEVDVLDLAPLAPLAHRGLRGALVTILLISIFSLIFFAGRAASVVPLLQVIAVALAAVALVLPVWGLHGRIVEGKRARLAPLHAEIRACEESLLRSGEPESSVAATRLSALLALRQQLEAAREWPFGVSTYVRFGFYVAIGLGSWLGAALVERLLDVLLG